MSVASIGILPQLYKVLTCGFAFNRGERIIYEAR